MPGESLYRVQPREDQGHDRIVDKEARNGIARNRFLRQRPTCVRLPFNYRHFEDDRKPGEFGESESFKYIDRVLEWFAKYDLYAVLDLHAAPGAERGTGIPRATTAKRSYGDIAFMQRTADLCAFIASRYANQPRSHGIRASLRTGLPVARRAPPVQHGCIKAIREVDKKHIILVQPNEWGKKIKSLRLEVFEDPLVMPIINHYVDQVAPFDKIQKEYPCEYQGKYYGREQVAGR